MFNQINLTVPHGMHVNLSFNDGHMPHGPQPASMGGIFCSLNIHLGMVSPSYGPPMQGQCGMPVSYSAKEYGSADNGPYSNWMQPPQSGMSCCQGGGGGYGSDGCNSWDSGGYGSDGGAGCGYGTGGGAGPGAGQAAGAGDPSSAAGQGAGDPPPIPPETSGSVDRTYTDFADPDDPSGGPADHRDKVDQYGYVYTWDPDYGRYEACGKDDGNGDLIPYSDDEYCSVNNLDQQTPADSQGQSGSPPSADQPPVASPPPPSQSAESHHHHHRRHHHHHHHHWNGGAAGNGNQDSASLNIDVSTSEGS
jgi:hypothetical protein